MFAMKQNLRSQAVFLRLQPSPKDARQFYAILRGAADAEMVC